MSYAPPSRPAPAGAGREGVLVASLCGRSCAGCSCLAISERAATRRAVRRALSVASPAQGLLPFTPGTNLRAVGRKESAPARLDRRGHRVGSGRENPLGCQTFPIAPKLPRGALAAAELAVPARFWPLG